MHFTKDKLPLQDRACVPNYKLLISLITLLTAVVSYRRRKLQSVQYQIAR